MFLYTKHTLWPFLTRFYTVGITNRPISDFDPPHAAVSVGLTWRVCPTVANSGVVQLDLAVAGGPFRVEMEALGR